MYVTDCGNASLFTRFTPSNWAVDPVVQFDADDAGCHHLASAHGPVVNLEASELGAILKNFSVLGSEASW